TRVLPGMQSAFVDLGLERDTFLYVSDFFEENEEYDKITTDEKPARNGGFTRRDGRTERPPQNFVKPAELPAEVVEASPVAETPAAAAAPSERPEGAPSPQGDQRDRGRRSRRRRNRGRGFPDSKYASDVDSPAVEAPAAEMSAPEAEFTEASEPQDVILLPGESLAKYSRPPVRQPAPEVASAASSAETNDASAAAEPVPDKVQEVETAV